MDEKYNLDRKPINKDLINDEIQEYTDIFQQHAAGKGDWYGPYVEKAKEVQKGLQDFLEQGNDYSDEDLIRLAWKMYDNHEDTQSIQGILGINPEDIPPLTAL